MSTVWSLDPWAASRPIAWKQLVSRLALPLLRLRLRACDMVRRGPQHRLTDLRRINPHLLADIGCERSAPLAQQTWPYWHR